MTSLKRYLLCIVFVMVGGNILLHAWFSNRVRNSANEKIVQKAYIVSRLISVAGSRAIAADKPAIVRNVVEEALKDQHLAAVVVKRKSGEVLLETVNHQGPGKQSIFETPILMNGKTVGTVITRFNQDGPEINVARDLAVSATLQSVVLAVITLATVVTLDLRRRKSAAASSLNRSIGYLPDSVATPAKQLPLADVILLPYQPAMAAVANATLPAYPPDRLESARPEAYLPCQLRQAAAAVPPEPVTLTSEPPDSYHQLQQQLFSDVLAAGEALRQALELIAAESRQTAQAHLFAQEARLWSKACTDVAERTAPLINAGIDIITSFREECRSTAGSRTAAAGSAGNLRSAAMSASGAAPDKGPFPESLATEDTTAETGLFLELEQSLRHSALTDLLATTSASKAAATIVSSLDRLVADLEMVSSDLRAGCDELYENAVIVDEDDAAAMQADTDTAAVAASLRRLAEAHGDRIMSLGEKVKQAKALYAKLGDELQAAHFHGERAGTTVANAATAAMQGSSIFTRLHTVASNQQQAAAEANAAMGGLTAELEAQAAVFGKLAENSAALDVAVETLRLATAFSGDIPLPPRLRELAIEQSALSLGDEHEPPPEQLIRQAQLAINRLLLHITTSDDGTAG